MGFSVKGCFTVVAASAAVLSAAGGAVADADAQGASVNSPGILSGGVDQIPVHVPVNLCGGSTNVIGLLNPTFGNPCAND